MGLCGNRTEGAGVYALSAADATIIINNAKTVFIVSNSIYRTGLFTGTGKLGNGTVGAGCCTHSTFLTFHRINVGSLVRHGNGTKVTTVLAGLT